MIWEFNDTGDAKLANAENLSENKISSGDLQNNMNIKQ